MENIVDMHIHSINSDGEYEVSELVNMIKIEGVKMFSITDHDCIESVSDINNLDLEDLVYIPGVEVSSIYKGIKMHILGYNLRVNNTLKLMLKTIQEKRLKRFYEVINLIEKNEGINIPDEVLESVISKSVSLARPQIISMLMELGYGDNRDFVYKTLVKPYKSKVSYRENLEDVIRVLKECDAKIILAHPKEIEEEYDLNIASILPELLDLGIDGIEAFNSIHNLEDIKRYTDLVEKYHICYTGGSDYHGPNVKPHIMIGGCSFEGMKVRQISLNK